MRWSSSTRFLFPFAAHTSPSFGFSASLNRNVDCFRGLAFSFPEYRSLSGLLSLPIFVFSFGLHLRYRSTGVYRYCVHSVHLAKREQKSGCDLVMSSIFGFSDYRRVAFTLLAIFAIRLLQANSLLSQFAIDTSLSAAFERLFSLGLAAFAFVPLFGLLLIQPRHDLALPPVVIKNRSRDELLLRYLRAAFWRSLLFSLALSASAILLLVASGIPLLTLIPFMVIEFLLILSFFFVCALMFYLATMLAGEASIVAGYALIIVFGVWDFMSMNVVGGGLPPIGWSHILLSSPITVSSLSSSLAWFALLACSIAFGLSLAIRCHDFIGRNSTQ